MSRRISLSAYKKNKEALAVAPPSKERRLGFGESVSTREARAREQKIENQVLDRLDVLLKRCFKDPGSAKGISDWLCTEGLGGHAKKGLARALCYVKVWSAALRVEDMPQEEHDKDMAEIKARAAFGACVCAINAVNSMLYRFAEASKKGKMGDAEAQLVKLASEALPRMVGAMVFVGDKPRARGLHPTEHAHLSTMVASWRARSALPTPPLCDLEQQLATLKSATTGDDARAAGDSAGAGSKKPKERAAWTLVPPPRSEGVTSTSGVGQLSPPGSGDPAGAARAEGDRKATMESSLKELFARNASRNSAKSAGDWWGTAFDGRGPFREGPEGHWSLHLIRAREKAQQRLKQGRGLLGINGDGGEISRDAGRHSGDGGAQRSGAGSGGSGGASEGGKMEGEGSDSDGAPSTPSTVPSEASPSPVRASPTPTPAAEGSSSKGSPEKPAVVAVGSVNGVGGGGGEGGGAGGGADSAAQQLSGQSPGTAKDTKDTKDGKSARDEEGGKGGKDANEKPGPARSLDGRGSDSKAGQRARSPPRKRALSKREQEAEDRQRRKELARRAGKERGKAAGLEKERQRRDREVQRQLIIAETKKKKAEEEAKEKVEREAKVKADELAHRKKLEEQQAARELQKERKRDQATKSAERGREPAEESRRDRGKGREQERPRDRDRERERDRDRRDRGPEGRGAGGRGAEGRGSDGRGAEWKSAEVRSTEGRGAGKESERSSATAGGVRDKEESRRHHGAGDNRERSDKAGRGRGKESDRVGVREGNESDRAGVRDGKESDRAGVRDKEEGRRQHDLGEGREVPRSRGGHDDLHEGAEERGRDGRRQQDSQWPSREPDLLDGRRNLSSRERELDKAERKRRRNDAEPEGPRHSDRHDAYAEEEDRGNRPSKKKNKKDKRDKKDKRLKAGSEEGARGRKRSRDFDHIDGAPPDDGGPSRARAGSRDYASMQADPPRRSGTERGGAERGGADSYRQRLEPESSLGGGDRRDTSRHGAGLHRMDTEVSSRGDDSRRGGHAESSSVREGSAARREDHRRDGRGDGPDKRNRRSGGGGGGQGGGGDVSSNALGRAGSSRERHGRTGRDIDTASADGGLPGMDIYRPGSSPPLGAGSELGGHRRPSSGRGDHDRGIGLKSLDMYGAGVGGREDSPEGRRRRDGGPDEGRHRPTTLAAYGTSSDNDVRNGGGGGRAERDRTEKDYAQSSDRSGGSRAERDRAEKDYALSSDRGGGARPERDRAEKDYARSSDRSGKESSGRREGGDPVARASTSSSLRASRRSPERTQQPAVRDGSGRRRPSSPLRDDSRGRSNAQSRHGEGGVGSTGGGGGRLGHSSTGPSSLSVGLGLSHAGGGGGGGGAASLQTGSAMVEMGRERHRLSNSDRDRDRHRREEREERRGGRSEDRRRGGGGGGGGRDSGRRGRGDSRSRADSRDEDQGIDSAPPQEEEPEEGELVIEELSVARAASPHSRTSRWGNVEDVGKLSLDVGSRLASGRGEPRGEPRGGLWGEPRAARDRGARATAMAKDGPAPAGRGEAREKMEGGAVAPGSEARSAEVREDGELESVPPRGKPGVGPEVKERSDGRARPAEPAGNSRSARQRRHPDDGSRGGSDAMPERIGGAGVAAAAAASPAAGPEKARARPSGNGEGGRGTEKSEKDRDGNSGSRKGMSKSPESASRETAGASRERRLISGAGVVANSSGLAGAAPEPKRVGERSVSSIKGLEGARGNGRTDAAGEKAGGVQAAPRNGATVGAGASSHPSTDAAGVKAPAAQANPEKRKVSPGPVGAAAIAERVASAPLPRPSPVKSLTASRPVTTDKSKEGGATGAGKGGGDKPGNIAAAAAAADSSGAKAAAVATVEDAQKTGASSGGGSSERTNVTPAREAPIDAEGSNTGGKIIDKVTGSDAPGVPSHPVPLRRSSSGRSASGEADPPTRRSTGGDPGELTSFLRKNHRRKQGERESPGAATLSAAGQSNREPGLSGGPSPALGSREESAVAATTASSASPANGQRVSAFSRLGAPPDQGKKDSSSAASTASEGSRNTADAGVRRAPVGLAASWGSGSSVDRMSGKAAAGGRSGGGCGRGSSGGIVGGGGGGGGGGSSVVDASKPASVKREKGSKEEAGDRQGGDASRLVNAALVSSRDSGRRGRRGSETGGGGGRGRERDGGGSGGGGGGSSSSKDQ